MIAARSMARPTHRPALVRDFLGGTARPRAARGGCWTRAQGVVTPRHSRERLGNARASPSSRSCRALNGRSFCSNPRESHQAGCPAAPSRFFSGRLLHLVICGSSGHLIGHGARVPEPAEGTLRRAFAVEAPTGPAQDPGRDDRKHCTSDRTQEVGPPGCPVIQHQGGAQ